MRMESIWARRYVHGLPGVGAADVAEASEDGFFFGLMHCSFSLPNPCDPSWLPSATLIATLEVEAAPTFPWDPPSATVAAAISAFY